MPLYDEYAQNIPFPVQTDRASIRSWGEALVDAVAQRSVMRFPSTSVRGAVITEPVAGMQTWIEDQRRMDIYNGSTWVSLAVGVNTWVPIPLAPGYVYSLARANDQGPPAYRLVELFGARAIMFRGAFAVDYPPDNQAPNNRQFHLNLLPDTARPDIRRCATLATSVAGGSDATVKLNIEPSGRMQMYNIGGGNRPQWISLDGVTVSL